MADHEPLRENPQPPEPPAGPADADARDMSDDLGEISGGAEIAETGPTS